MQISMYSVYDKRTGMYQAAFEATHPEYAKRRFSDSVCDPKSRIAQYPEDFELYETGKFEPETGKITYHEQFHYICNGVNVDVGKRRPVDVQTTNPAG